MEIFLPLLGGVIAGASLVWAIYSWVLDRRDEMRHEEIANLNKTVFTSEERTEKLLGETRAELSAMYVEFHQMRENYSAYKEKLEALIHSFQDYVKRIDKLMDHQQAKLDDLGRVIYNRKL